jgi:hypothetical protein
MVPQHVRLHEAVQYPSQCGSYRIDTNEKKTTLYHTGLIIQLQDSIVQSPNLSYNDLASVAIDQERMMKAIAKAEEKKRKRMVHVSFGTGGSGAARPMYHIVYAPPSGQLRRPPQQQYWGNHPQYQ